MKKVLLSFALAFSFILCSVFVIKAQSYTIVTIAGNGTGAYNGDGIQATAAELHNPYGLCVDNAVNVYTADYYNDRIRKINTAGVISTVAGTGAAGFGGDGGPATAAMVSQPSDVSW